MNRSTLSALALVLGLGLVILACEGGGGSIDTGESNTGPVTQAASTSGGRVSATFASASLGGDCDNSGGAVKAESSSDFAPGVCAEGSRCGVPCQQSNMQITFSSTSGGGRVSIVSVTLRDSAGNQVDSLTAKTPKAWNGSIYTSWDQNLKSGETKASWNLSAPDWSKLGGGTESKTRSQSYVVRVVLSIDGETITIESTAVTREPEVVT